MNEPSSLCAAAAARAGTATPGRTATFVWLLLVAATLLSWRIGIVPRIAHGHWAKLESVAIMVIALVKIRCVLLYFMQLKTAPLVWRLLFEAWLLLVGVAMIVIFYTTAGPPAS